MYNAAYMYHVSGTGVAGTGTDPPPSAESLPSYSTLVSSHFSNSTIVQLRMFTDTALQVGESATSCSLIRHRPGVHYCNDCI
ncbi:hypothetical protein JB92DRAFT_2916080 [Gautieria morchelliformis]|nr:hypothetical protein JB92DRAFT_2916080 [Gautieria morchelliformis]